METVPISEDDVVELVYLCKKSGIVKRKIGMVIESSQNMSSDEEDDDDSSYQALRKNAVRVAWYPTGTAEVVDEVKLKIVDRSLVPGDVVGKIATGQQNQKGFITKTKISCVLQCLTQPFFIFGIDSSLLVDFLPFQPDSQQVYMDDWVGAVEKVTERIVLKFQDGARCELNTEDLVGMLSDFVDLNDKRDKASEFSTDSFYVGQSLKGELGNLEGLRWIEQTKNYSSKTMKKNRFKSVVLTVEEVEVSSVDVVWLCRGYSESSPGEEMVRHPPTPVSGKDLERLKTLDYFGASDFRLGSKAYYTVQDGDKIVFLKNKVNKDVLIDEFISNSRKSAKFVSSSNEANLAEVVSECESSHAGMISQSVSLTEEDVGSSESKLNIDSNIFSAQVTLCFSDNIETKKNGSSIVQSSTVRVSTRSQPSISMRRHKNQRTNATKPHRKKKQHSSKKIDDKKLSERSDSLCPGSKVPVEVVAVSTSVEVMWQDGTKESEIPSVDLYAVRYVDDLEFFPGDYVSPISTNELKSLNDYGIVQKVNHFERTCIIQWFKLADAGKLSSFGEELGSKEELSVFDIKEHSDFKFSPGSVVIRVGGVKVEDCKVEDGANKFPVVPSMVGGQVVESGLDGKLLVHWADGMESYCRPVELFLVGSDVSDGESEFDSEDSQSEKSGSTRSTESCEWETEEEEEELGMKGKNDKQLIIEESDRESMEVGFEFFSRNRITLRQYLVILSQILDGTPDDFLSASSELEKSEELSSSECVQLSTMSCSNFDKTSSVQMNNRNDGKEKCDLDGFFSVLMEIINLHKTMHFMKNICLVNSWQDLKKFMEVVKNQIKKEKDDNLNAPAMEESCESESVCKSVNEKSEGSSVDHHSSPVTADQEVDENSLLVSSLDEVFQDKIQPEKNKLHLVRQFYFFVKSLADEFDECYKLYCYALKHRKPATETKDLDSVNFNGACCKDDVNLEILEDSFKELKEELKVSVSMEEEYSSCHDCMEDRSDEEEPKDNEIVSEKVFTMMETVSDCHHYKKHSHNPINPKTFFAAVKKELNLLKTCLPKGIHVKGFESRLDLFSAMIEGPSNTPYEYGLFFFDGQLAFDYPKSPPKLHYISYCIDRLNPNLYEDGKVCVSLLGTWSGRGTEVWNPSESNLLQVLVSIQGLILNQEPYYNEAGYEKHRDTQLGIENSRMYTEMAIVKLAQAMTKLLLNPYEIFKDEIEAHFKENANKYVSKMKSLIHPSKIANSLQNSPRMNQDHQFSSSSTNSSSQAQDESRFKEENLSLGFSLFPVSKGFKIALAKSIDQFIEVAASKNFLIVPDEKC